MRPASAHVDSPVMHAAPGHETPRRGAAGLLAQFAALERVTTETEPASGKARLEDRLGSELARLLVGALALGGRAAA
jgi:hypothetical protein